MRRRMDCLLICLVISLLANGLVSAEKVKLVLMHNGPDEMINAQNKVIEMFEAEYPNIDIEFIRTGSGEHNAKMLTMFAAGVGPDLFSIAPDELITKGHIMEISSLLDKDPEAQKIVDRLLPGVWEMSAYPGNKRYYIPNGAVITTMFLNLDHFDEVGVPRPGASWTWEEFRTAARRFTRDKAQGGIRFGFIGDLESQLQGMLPWIFQAGGQPFDNWYRPTTSRFNQTNVVEALQFIYDMRWRDNSIPQQSQTTQGWSPNMFFNGEVSMLHHNPARIGQLAQQVTFQWDLQRLPYYKEHAAVGNVSGQMINANTKYPEEAWAYVKFLFRPEAQALTSPFAQIPVVKDVALGSWLNQPIPGINKRALLEEFAVTRNRAQYPGYFEAINKAFQDEWTKAFRRNEVSVQNVVTSIDDKLKALLLTLAGE